MNPVFPRLLVVDDDPHIQRLLSVNLGADGYDVVTAGTGQEALKSIAAQLPDAIVVDLMLPDLHGFALCERIQAAHDIPIIVLSAVGTEKSITSGLERWADDYVTKPFSYPQLRARIAAVLRRTRHLRLSQKQEFLNGRISLDFARRQVTLDGRDVSLTPKECRLLAALVRRAGQITPSAVLLDEAWPDGDGDESRLWVHIRSLRSKIEPDPSHPTILQSVRGLGYRLSLP